jgi:uncharacterized membrane protein YdjX (TVP38/TMEM64 family)
MNQTMQKGLKWGLLVIAIAASIWLIRTYGLDVESLRSKVKSLGVLAPLVLFGLRFVSVVIPVIPGTAFALVTGLTLGLGQGLLVIILADFSSCSLSFYLSRRYGRTFVERLIGTPFMNRVDRIGQQHLEHNLPLLIALLMTGFFDFVSYGVGLTHTAWSRFLVALCISIPIAHTPMVIVGAKLLEKQKSYLLLGIAILIAFGVALITGILQRKSASID